MTSRGTLNTKPDLDLIEQELRAYEAAFLHVIAGVLRGRIACPFPLASMEFELVRIRTARGLILNERSSA